MSWFRRKAAEEKTEVVQAIDQLREARKERRAALTSLLNKLGEIPVDNGLAVVGKELTTQPKDK